MLRAIDGLGVSLTDWWPVRGAVLAVTVLAVLLVLRYARRVTSILLATALLAGLMIANLLLASYAYYRVPPPPADAPRTGTAMTREIPGTQSGFAARPAQVYLPSATVNPATPRPVLVLLHDAAGGPQDWVAMGAAGRVVDDWAARNGGVPPILVMPDVTGSVDGPVCAGPIETYLTRDLPQFISANYATVSPGAGWAVAGHGAGGTCALSLALRNPTNFATFADFGGGLVGLGFAPDPEILVRNLGTPAVGGWFAAGDGDAAANTAAALLYLRAQQVGLDTCLDLLKGAGVGYETSSRALVDALPWIVARINQTPQPDLKASCDMVAP